MADALSPAGGTDRHADVAIVGAGAAGLMCAISVGRELAGTGRRLVLLDGAARVGVKILVAGGGRCNVTHHAVDEKQYAGGSRNTIRRVLRSFSVADTVALFAALGVELKREDTGKLFPVTDSARTVLDALLGEVARLGVELWHPWRVAAVEHTPGGFTLRREGSDQSLHARSLVLATGGRALPKSGSDGGGYELARTLGHSITPRVFPALVPLRVGERSRWLTELSGVGVRAGVEVRRGGGARLARFENGALCTHFGLSGPAVMDASRYLTAAVGEDARAHLQVAWLPGEAFDSVDASLCRLGRRTPLSWLRERLPERLARALCAAHGVDPNAQGSRLPRTERRALAHALVEMPVEIVGDRGYAHAEATAGGVPLDEIDPRGMRSRRCDGLWLVGEILDVDGRIGGFNFQWAWSSGWVAGRSLAAEVRCAASG